MVRTWGETAIVRVADEVDVTLARLRAGGLTAWSSGLIDGVQWGTGRLLYRSPVTQVPCEQEPPAAERIEAEIEAVDAIARGEATSHRLTAWVLAVGAALEWLTGRRSELPLEQPADLLVGPGQSSQPPEG